MSWYGFSPYVPVAHRRASAAREMAKLAKKGHTVSPVKIEGRQIARTFWGKAWCENLESYSDFENRLPRGRTYVRNGSVVDLQIKSGRVTARVSGSELYEIDINVKPLSKPHWQAISSRCAGKIASVLELLKGRLSQGVMEIITHREQGLFPKPSEISLECSCPDWAGMCKHVAAALYGVGARLDEKPELLFVLRQVDHLELIEQAASGTLAPTADSNTKTIADADLADVFGIEMDTAEIVSPIPAVPGTAAKSGTAATSQTGKQRQSGRLRKAEKAKAVSRRKVSRGKLRKRGIKGTAPKPRKQPGPVPPTSRTE